MRGISTPSTPQRSASAINSTISLRARGARESQRNTKRRALFDAQDEIDRRREQLIAEIESKPQQRVSQKMLFSIRWSLT